VIDEQVSLIDGTINCLSIQTSIPKRTTFLEDYRWKSIYKKKMMLFSKKESKNIRGITYFYEVDRFSFFLKIKIELIKLSKSGINDEDLTQIFQMVDKKMNPLLKLFDKRLKQKKSKIQSSNICE